MLHTVCAQGTFDPITKGHIYGVNYAFGLFVDKVVFAIADNPEKRPLFTLDERIQMAKHSLAQFGDKVEVVGFSDLAVDVAHRNGAQVLFRGIRDLSDQRQERAMEKINNDFSVDLYGKPLPTYFYFAPSDMEDISSSWAKNVARVAPKISLLDRFVDRPVAEAMLRKLGRAHLIG